MPLSKKKLRMALDSVECFSNPNIKFEQYSTSSELATDILYDCEERDSSVSRKVIADLGCGPGMLSIGSILLGADYVVGFEIDENAISDFTHNIEDLELQSERLDIVKCDIRTLLKDEEFIFKNYFDTVITNPPFGTTKDSNGIDVIFLHTALSMASGHVYSLHKTSTRPFILKQTEKYGAKSEVVAQLVFDLPKSYKKHKHDSVNIEVDLVHSWFEKQK